MEKSLENKTVIVTGASRGIGKAIAIRAAEAGANVVVIAKTSTPHPTLPGTVHETAEAIEKLGRKALPIALDLRDDVALEKAIQTVMDTFGRIDVLINNAGALNMTNTENTPMKRFDLMMGVNVRSTFAASKFCMPFLSKAPNPHIINISPPVSMKPKWFKDFTAYTISKYGMSMCTAGMAAEFADRGIAVNSLWPKTCVATSAIAVNFPKEILQASRKPEVVADAALWIVTQNSKTLTGNFFLDEDVLRNSGVTDFTKYAVQPGVPLAMDFYVETH